MTRRMVEAVSQPARGRARPLHGPAGHRRPRHAAGVEVRRGEVFTACRDNGIAVEINSRPERRDPPTRLLNLALEIGCLFSIDTDAHAPGQLEFLGYGAQRALDASVPVDRIVNTWPAEKLLEWTASVTLAPRVQRDVGGAPQRFRAAFRIGGCAGRSRSWPGPHP